MAVISPKIGLYTPAAIYAFFGMMQFFMPIWFLAQYNIDLGSLALVEKLILGITLQIFGVYAMKIAGILAITARNGTDEQRATTCLMQGVASSVIAVVTAASVGFWTELGVPASGIYFNLGLDGLVAVLALLGAGFPPAFKPAPLRKPLYWGFLGLIAYYALFSLGMFFATESMLEGYGVEIGGQAHGVLSGMARFTYAPAFLNLILLLLGHLVTVGSCASYGVARLASGMALVLCAGSAVSATFWACLNEDGEYDKILSGQHFNAGLWLFFFLLSYVPIAAMDRAVREGVEKEVEGAYSMLKGAF